MIHYYLYRTTYRLAMTTETVLLTVLFSTLYASTLAPRWMFAVWVWLIYLTFPGMPKHEFGGKFE